MKFDFFCSFRSHFWTIFKIVYFSAWVVFVQFQSIIMFFMIIFDAKKNKKIRNLTDNMVFNAISIKKIMNKTRIIEIQMLLVHAQFLAKSNISHVSPYIFQAKKMDNTIIIKSKYFEWIKFVSCLQRDITSQWWRQSDYISSKKKKIFFCYH